MSNNNKPKTTFQLNDTHQNIAELWETLANVATKRVEDNKKSEEYPLSVRVRQLESLKILISDIEASHNKMLQHFTVS